MPKKTTALVTCPLGKEKSVEGKSSLLGLGDIINALLIETKSVLPPIAPKSKRPYRQCLLTRKTAAVPIETARKLSVSKAYEIPMATWVKAPELTDAAHKLMFRSMTEKLALERARTVKQTNSSTEADNFNISCF